MNTFSSGHEALARPLKLLSYDDLKPTKGIPWSKVQIWRRERLGLFPKRVALSTNRCGWFEHEIDAWLEAKRAERDSAA
jgi:predicted DNA-binding transcriptional regulator AlpA